MSSGGLLLLLGLLTLWAELTPVSGRYCPKKPGKCPTPDPNVVTICIVTCGSDWECPGKGKCCSYGCLVQCMGPK
ncbi:scuwaprin-a-like [Protobothrops mucrosquamatus]|uniref:scuwaprin-a-like n=1 Tax=Protobothrops mucrosquamatus TaxID=103944 RepID=UPI000775D8CD|nr:scuwaprin-a-like [Protobothrops mucrosquamatus]